VIRLQNFVPRGTKFCHVGLTPKNAQRHGGHEVSRLVALFCGKDFVCFVFFVVSVFAALRRDKQNMPFFFQ
jgi:hypothetical protein